VDVTKLVESVNWAEHLSNVESSMAVCKDTGIVK